MIQIKGTFSMSRTEGMIWQLFSVPTDIIMIMKSMRSALLAINDEGVSAVTVYERFRLERKTGSYLPIII